MTVQFDLSDYIASILAPANQDVARATKEAALVELYRQDKLSHHEFAQALGLTRFEADDVLKRHNVTEDLMTADELMADIERARRIGA